MEKPWIADCRTILVELKKRSKNLVDLGKDCIDRFYFFCNFLWSTVHSMTLTAILQDLVKTPEDPELREQIFEYIIAKLAEVTNESIEKTVLVHRLPGVPQLCVSPV